MYKLTVEFDTKEELIAFLSETDEAAEVTVSKKSSKKKTSKKSAPKKEDKVEAPKEEVKPEPKAEIFQEPATKPTPSQAAFNRDACLKRITKVIGDLQSNGMQGNELANMIAGIFADLGLAQCKIGDLEDSSLINFSMAFDKKVEEFMNETPEATSETSFI